MPRNPEHGPPPPEARDDGAQPSHTLDDSSLESLLEVIKNVETIRGLEREAQETLERYGREYSKIADSFLVPQSPDKHAEGPLMESHLRLAIMYLKAIERGLFYFTDIPEFQKQLGGLSAEDRMYVEHEFQEMERVVREKPNFFEMYLMFHDIAKLDTIGFTSATGSRGEALGFVKFETTVDPKEKLDETALADRKAEHQRHLFKLYRELLQGFVEKHGDLLEKPTAFQEAFYGEYGISLTHYQHGPEAIRGDARYVIIEALSGSGFSSADQATFRNMIEHHIEPHMSFAESKRNPKNYSDLLKRMREAVPLELSDTDLMRFLRVGQVFDLLANKKMGDAGRRTSEVRPTVNFILAEKAYAPYAAEQARIVRERQAFVNAGMTAEWLIQTCGLVPGPIIGKTLRAVSAALQNEKLELPPELEPYRAAIEEKLAGIRSILGGGATSV